MLHIYRRAPMLKCDFNKVALSFSQHFSLRTNLEGCSYGMLLEMLEYIQTTCSKSCLEHVWLNLQLLFLGQLFLFPIKFSSAFNPCTFLRKLPKESFLEFSFFLVLKIHQFIFSWYFFSFNSISLLPSL